MARFDRQIQTALRLIAKNGQACVWHKQTTQAVNPDKPWLGDVTDPVDHTVTICFVPVRSQQDLVAMTFPEHMDFQVGRTYGLMGQVAFEPMANDFITRDGKELSLRMVDVLSPNGQIILHYLEFQL